jgi:hypothetical protein
MKWLCRAVALFPEVIEKLRWLLTMVQKYADPLL